MESTINDCEALLDLYLNTGGENWLNSEGWTPLETLRTECCMRRVHGVSCNAEGRVTNTTLNANNLVGIIPPSIGNMTELVRLELGGILNEDGSVAASDHLSDPIPREIGNLVNLRKLFLTSNNFSSIPAEIGNLGKLEQLILYKNQLKSIPRTIGNLKNLVHLELYDNRLTSVPHEIGSLHQLVRLWLSSNELVSLPGDIGSLENLEVLMLQDNSLKSLPPEIANLTSLEYLYLYGNDLTLLPIQIGYLCSLQVLYLFNNELLSLPGEIGMLKNLREFDTRVVFGNLLRSLPPEIGNLKILQKLHAFDNRLESLQKEICNLPELKELWLDNNQLQSLPENIGNMTNLNDFLCAGNQIQELPIGIGNLKEVQQMDLSSNQLLSIPSEMCGMRSLLYLDLSGNELKNFPERIDKLNDMQYLDISQNELVSLPSSIGKLTALEYLYVYSNAIDGPFPESDFPQMIELLCQGNDITELSSETLLSMKKVRVMNLCRNLLSKFDFDLVNDKLENIVVLDVSNNKIDHEFPRLTGTFSVVNLARNQFIGRNPFDCTQDFCQYYLDSDTPTHLTTLDLSHNVLERFEVWISRVYGKLSDLDLTSTSLQGEEPLKQMVNFPGLKSLSVDSNDLCGTIDVVQNLPSLVRISARNNPNLRYSGTFPSYLVKGTLNPTTMCYDVESKDGRFSVDLDDSYFNYTLCYCMEGFYGDRVDQLNHQCYECKDNAVCPGPIIGTPCDKGQCIFADEGYWASPPYTAEQMIGGRYPSHFLPCNGAGTSSSPCRPDKGNYLKTCSDGYEDRLCSKCSSGHFSLSTNLCSECPSSDGWKVVFALLMGIGLVLLIIISFIAGTVSSGLVKILIFFIQVASGLRTSLPSSLSHWREAGNSVSNFGIVGTECYIDSWTFALSYITSMITPFVICAIVGLIFLFGLFIKLRRNWVQRCIRSAVFLLYLNYMNVTLHAILPLSCEKDSGLGEEFMVNVPYEKCSTWMRAISIIMLIFYIAGAPLVLLVFGRISKRDNLVFGFLKGCYVKKHQYWEVVIAFRRVIFIMTSLLIPILSSYHAFGMVLVLIVSLVLQVHANPFKHSYENGVEVASLSLLILDYVVSVQLKTPLVEDSSSISIVVLLLNIIFIGFVVLLIVWKNGLGFHQKSFGTLKRDKRNEMQKALIIDDREMA